LVEIPDRIEVPKKKKAGLDLLKLFEQEIKTTRLATGQNELGAFSNFYFRDYKYGITIHQVHWKDWELTSFLTDTELIKDTLENVLKIAFTQRIPQDYKYTKLTLEYSFPLIKDKSYLELIKYHNTLGLVIATVRDTTKLNYAAVFEFAIETKMDNTWKVIRPFVKTQSTWYRYSFYLEVIGVPQLYVRPF
jgi:hypothetical protein